MTSTTQRPFPLIKHLYEADFLTWLDLSKENKALQSIQLEETLALERFIWNEIKKGGGKVGIGGYNEFRDLYRRSRHFDASDPRAIHLGIDLWAAAGTPVYAPWSGTFHSEANNEGFGNYGPTLIFTHETLAGTLHALYGHMAVANLGRFKKGDKISEGTCIGHIGPFPENGDWPPHLHFQLMYDLQAWEGDYPGVASPSEKEYYLNNCPDPVKMLCIQ